MRKMKGWQFMFDTSFTGCQLTRRHTRFSRFETPSRFKRYSLGWIVCQTFLVMMLWACGKSVGLATSVNAFERGGSRNALEQFSPQFAKQLELTPAELKPWIPWVLRSHPEVNCPFNSAKFKDRQCLWPTQLQLTREGERFLFEEFWIAYSEGWLLLPGGLFDDEAQNWPVDVELNGKPAIVVKHQKRPAIFVPPGRYQVTGQLPVVNDQPFVRIPPDTALISVTYEERVLINPNSDEQGRLWLAPEKRVNPDHENALSYRIFRRFVDGVPVTLESRIQLDVGGTVRVVRLPNVLLPDTRLVSLNTVLPTQWQGNDLLVRVKPGQWEVNLESRFSGPVSQVLVPVAQTKSAADSVSVQTSSDEALPKAEPKAEGNAASEAGDVANAAASQVQAAQKSILAQQSVLQTPDQEIWVLEINSQFRSITTSGLIAIDPAQTALPQEWQHLRAFLPKAGETWAWTALHMDSPVGRNKLTLQRNVWMDFSGDGFTVVDALNGTVGEAWRLALADDIQLGQVSVNHVPAVIGRVAMAEGETDQGVELRSPDVSLAAVGRINARSTQLPVSAWSSPLESVHWNLHIPAGWSVAAVRGADRVTGVWWSNWRLWDVFWVALLVVGFRRLCHLPMAILAGVLLVLSYQSHLAVPPLLWAFTLLVMVFQRLLPKISNAGNAATEQRFMVLRSGVVGCGALLVVLWAVVLAPILFTELRYLLLPQTAHAIIPDHDDYGEMAMSTQDESVFQPARKVMAPRVEMDSAQDSVQESPAVQENRTVSAYVLGKSMGSTLPQSAKPMAEAAPPGVQTGPGQPRWAHAGSPVRLDWNGPILPNETFHIYWAPPWVLQCLSAVKLLLWPMLFLGLLFALAQPIRPLALLVKRLPLPAFLRNTSAVSLFFVFCGLFGGLLVGGMPSMGYAETFPDRALLDDLEKHLLAPPSCAPGCYAIESLQIQADTVQLSMQLAVHAQETVFLPVPHGLPNWIPRLITVDGVRSIAASRFYTTAKQARSQRSKLPSQQTPSDAASMSLQLVVPPGRHTIVLTGLITAEDELQIAFPWSIKNIAVEATAWEVIGLKGTGLINDTMILKRRNVDDAEYNAMDEWLSVPAPVFARVHRQFDFGHTVMLTTRVERVAPRREAIVVSVPLLPQETLLTEHIPVKNRVAQANLAPGENVLEWRSRLVFSENTQNPMAALALELQAANLPTQVETWQFRVSSQWHMVFDGLQPLPLSLQQYADKRRWEPTFWPWPGETVHVLAVRPETVVGEHMTVRSARSVLEPGSRSTAVSWNFDVHNTVGAPFRVVLPSDVERVSLSVNGDTIPVSPHVGEIAPVLQPGEHQVVLEYRLNSGLKMAYSAPQIELPKPVANVYTKIQLPPSRWVLWLYGDGYGPWVSFWVAAILIVLSAIWIGRTPWVPLTTLQWLLLGFGFSLSFWPGLVLAFVWLVLVRARPIWALLLRKPWHYNAVQMVTLLFTLGLLLSFVIAVPSSLLGRPDMGIIGAQSPYVLTWYQDRLGDAFPSRFVFSVPLWVYRVVMLAWSLWMANLLVSWARWGWQQVSMGGLWKRSVKPNPAVKAQAVKTQEVSAGEVGEGGVENGETK